MKVVLLMHVRNLGQKGEIKEVSDGYYQNFLAPRQFAVPATHSQVSHIHNQQAKANEKLENMKESALSIKNKIHEKTLTIKAKASETGKLYASLHQKDLAAVMKTELHVEIPDKEIELAEPIKNTGDFSVKVHLYKDIAATLSIHVLAD